MMSLVGTLVHATPLAEAEERTSGKQTIQILKSTVLQSLAFFFFLSQEIMLSSFTTE